MVVAMVVVTVTVQAWLLTFSFLHTLGLCEEEELVVDRVGEAGGHG